MGHSIAIIIVGYNRIKSIERLISSLKSANYNENVDLIVSIDKSDSDAVETFADQIEWNVGKLVVDRHPQNLGLRNHIMSLGKWFNYYDAIIVLEDDVVVAPQFYEFAKKCVEKYYYDSIIAGIGLYSYNLNYQNSLPFYPLKGAYDVYLMQCAMSWGQVWMKPQWQDFYSWYLNHEEIPDNNNIPIAIKKWPKSSWLKYHISYCIECDKYFVYPYYALSTNNSDCGTHNRGYFNHSLYQVQLQWLDKRNFILPDIKDFDVIYDAFFNNIDLYRYIDIPQKECILDIYATRFNEKDNPVSKRYLLTYKKLNYKIVKTYGLQYRPVELNIILNSPGKGLYIYDLYQPHTHRGNYYPDFVLYSYYIRDFYAFMKQCGIGQYLIGPIKYIYNRILSKKFHI